MVLVGAALISIIPGKVGADLTIAEGYAAARLTALNLLQTVRQALGSLNQVAQIVDVFGVVNSSAGFTGQSKVMNGFSDCIFEIFGGAGRHSRTAIGGAELPFNIAVEIKMVIEVVTATTQKVLSKVKFCNRVFGFAFIPWADMRGAPFVAQAAERRNLYSLQGAKRSPSPEHNVFSAAEYISLRSFRCCMKP